MPSSTNTLWREVLGRLKDLQDEVLRVEDFVATSLETHPQDRAEAQGPVSPARIVPLSGEGAALSLESAPRLLARVRRELEADPLRALDLSYPDALFAAGAEPERAQRECLLRHSTHTARLAMYVAACHGFEPSTVEVVGLCALLHDIALEQVPAELFSKAGPLTAAERTSFEAHAAEGAEMVRSGRQLDGLLRAVVPAVVRQHHERADGSGYPDGLGEPHIHEFARLLALAEAYETMVSPRPYKAPMLPHLAMESLLLEAFGKGRPARFDRRLAASFLRALSLYPIGSAVRLASGATGQVVGSNPEAPDRPHVRVLWAPDGSPIERPRVVDLRAPGDAVAEAVPLPQHPGTWHPEPGTRGGND